MTSCNVCEKLITEDEFIENDGLCKECLGPDDEGDLDEVEDMDPVDDEVDDEEEDGLI